MVTFALLIVAGSFNLTYTSCPLLQLLDKWSLARRPTTANKQPSFYNNRKRPVVSHTNKAFLLLSFYAILEPSFLILFHAIFEPHKRHDTNMPSLYFVSRQSFLSHTKCMKQKHHAHAIFGCFVSTFLSHTKYRRYKNITHTTLICFQSKSQ